MPNRMSRVRVSVRERTATEDADWHDERPSFSHKRYQVLDTLVPLSGSRVFELGRSGFEADWEAQANVRPAIQDGWRIVTLMDGSPDLFFDVEKRMVRGRKQHLLLAERPEIQS